MQLAEYEQNVHKLCEKYLALKKRKDTKVHLKMALNSESGDNLSDVLKLKVIC